MRPLLFVIMPFFFINTSAQTEKMKLFRTKEYVNGAFYRQTNDTINVANGHIDVYFFKKHFYSPYYLPEKLVDERHKNRTISIWDNPNGKKDDLNNWETTYTYDNLGRVTRFTYSGCGICSQLPYNYTITYNSGGQVEQIQDTTQDSYKFYYNNDGDIVKFEEYLFDKLEVKIELLN